MADISISSYGVYIPSNRMERSAIAEAHRWAVPSLNGLAKGQKAFCNWDEDSITMAVEAARGCLKGATGSVGSVVFASTTPVYSDLQNASIVANAVGLDKVSTLDATGSLRSGISSLINAFERAAASDTLVLASDNRLGQPASTQEMEYGSGAVALTVSKEGGIANYLGSESEAVAFVDHFRAPDKPFDYFWEARWIRDEGYMKIVPPVVTRLLDKAGVTAADIKHFVINATTGGAEAAVARKLGIAKDAIVGNLFAQCGDTGAAHPLIMLASALEKAAPGDLILVVGFGAGCDAVLLRATEQVSQYKAAASVANALAAGRSDTHYMRLLSFTGQIDLDWGMRSEGDQKTALTESYRSNDMLSPFVGGKCQDCGQIQFPIMPMCVNCASTKSVDQVPLADAPAKIMTCTEDWLQYYPAPPLSFGLVQFDNGARVMMEFANITKEQLVVGMPLRMVFRIKERDDKRGYSRYFWKATPNTAAQG